MPTINPNTATQPASSDADVPHGRIDMHSHLLPDMDDGCEDMASSLRCIKRLASAGYIGAFCTPHLVPGEMMANPMPDVRRRTAELAQAVRDAKTLPAFRLWPGGELRLTPDAVSWMKSYGVPRLGDSRCVLVDLWDSAWPRWADDCFVWLLDQKYQPILAHPERLPPQRDLDDILRRLQIRGVWLQGNFASMTGEEGFHADRHVRQLLSEYRYVFMAMDVHNESGLESRLDGMALVAAEFDQALVDQLTIDAPRRHLLGLE